MKNDPRVCQHTRVVSEVCDQTLGVVCLECCVLLTYCWMSDHIPESLWNRACESDNEAVPCEQNRDDHCAICGEANMSEDQRIVMVTGGRDYADRAFVFETLDGIHEYESIYEIVHGACGWNCDRPGNWNEENLTGADRWADEWARARRVRVTRRPARWSTLGRAAGPKRNQEMVDMKPDCVCAFPGGAGTANAVKLAKAAGIWVNDYRRSTCNDNLSLRIS